MKRNAMNALKKWKSKPSRKPMLVFGARQVGKTYLLKQFGKEQFESVAYFDLEKQEDAKAAFSGNLNPAEIVQKLSQVAGHSINVETTLIVLDEIQASNRALASLKYFCEDMAHSFVVAAGSLLGVAVNREGYSAPVGKVETLTMHPATFDEFLLACGQDQMCNAIQECFNSNESYFMHKKALEHIWEYLLVGGMPEAINTFLSSGNFTEVERVQDAILNLYIADMAKYAQPIETARILEAWRSMPAQLLKENKKFKYTTIKKGGRAAQFEAALSWLETAGLVNRCVNITTAHAPLALYENRALFKMYLADTGLLSSMLRLNPKALLDQNNNSLNVGAVVENYVAQELRASGFALLYWTSPGKAEVDFVVDTGKETAIPIEVKSSTNVMSKSLGVYKAKYAPAYSIRVSPKNFGFENNLKSVPLYATFCIKGLMEHLTNM